MAFTLNTAELNALLAKGLISNEFYDKLAKSDKTDHSQDVKELAQEPPAEDQRLAENMPDWAKQPMMTPQQVADWTNAPVNAQGQTPVTPQNQPRPASPDIPVPPGGWRRDLEHTPPPGAAPFKSSVPTQEQLMWQMNQPPGPKPEQPVVAPNGVIIKPTQSQIAGFRALDEEAKRGIPPEQVAGGKPAPTPQAQPTPTPQPTPPVARPTGPAQPAYKGPGSLTYGPATGNVEKYLSPSEVERMQELNTRTLAAQNIEQRQGAVIMKEQDKLAQMQQDAAIQNEAMVNSQMAYVKSFRDKQDELWNKLYADTEAHGKRALDPEAAWKKGIFGDNSTGNKILAGIAIMLGGFGAGASAAGGNRGAGNMGLETINNAIDRDLKMQQFAIQNEGQSLAARRGLLNDRVNQFQDMSLGMSAARIDYLNMVEYKMKAYVASNASEKTKIQLDKNLIDLDNAKQDALYQFKQIADARARGQAAAAAALTAQMNNRMFEQFKEDQASLRKVNEKRIEAGLAPLSLSQYKGAATYEGAPSNPEFYKNQQAGQAQDNESARHLGDKLAPIAANLQAIDRAAKDYEKGGALEGISSVTSTALAGAKRTGPGKVVVPESMLQAEQNYDAVVNKYIHDTTGAALNKEGVWEGQNAGEAARLVGTIKGDGSAEARKHGLEMMRQDMEAQRRSFLLGATPGAAQKFQPPPSQQEKDKALGAEKNK